MKKCTAKKRRPAKTGRSDFYRLRLYIAGQTPNSVAAIANLKKICEDKLKGRYRIEVVDLLEKPQLAKGDQIIAIPTLVEGSRRRSSQSSGTSRRPRASSWGWIFNRPAEAGLPIAHARRRARSDGPVPRGGRPARRPGSSPG